jgi:AcrR family transcriptional regulator
MGSRERRQRHRTRVRQAILVAARELFVADGVRNVSLRQIANRIEYSPTVLYTYFRCKDDIFLALAEEDAAVRRIPAATGWSVVGRAGLTGLEPGGRAIHGVAAIRSRAVLAGDTRRVDIRTLHGVAQGVGWRASIPRVRDGPQRHSRMAPSLP